MKKTLLAAALLAGFAGAAQAQSSVTLYGIVDVGYVYTKTDGLSSVNELASGNQSGSRWGLQGAEDLGGGLKATFLLESGFDASNGQSLQGGRLFGRQSWAGLSGGFGDVRFGRQVTVTSEFFGAVDPFGAGFNAANFGNVFVASDTVRTDNTIKYLSPNFGGFQAGVNYSLQANGQEVPDHSDNDRLAGVAVRYSNGPLLVAASYDQVNFGLSGADKAKVWQVGGVYNFGVAKLHLAFADQDGIGGGITTGVAPGATGFEDTKAYLVGVTVPVGNGSVFGSYKRASDWDIDGWQVGYTYDVSKRTNLYTYFAYVDNINFNKANGTGTLGSSRGNVGDDNTTKQFGVGLRHKF